MIHGVAVTRDIELTSIDFKGKKSTHITEAPNSRWLQTQVDPGAQTAMSSIITLNI